MGFGADEIEISSRINGKSVDSSISWSTNDCPSSVVSMCSARVVGVKAVAGNTTDLSDTVGVLGGSSGPNKGDSHGAAVSDSLGVRASRVGRANRDTVERGRGARIHDRDSEGDVSRSSEIL